MNNTFAATLLAPPQRIPTTEDRAAAWGGLVGYAIAFLILLAIVLFIRSVVRKIRGDY